MTLFTDIGVLINAFFMGNTGKSKLFLNWSSGKDSALALYELLKHPDFRVEYLLSSLNECAGEVITHGVSADMLYSQFDAIGIPCGTVNLPENVSNEEYEQRMKTKVCELKDNGFDYTGFGDILQEDIRAFRKKQYANCGVECVFPLWKKDTTSLVRQYLDLDFRAIVVCVDASLLDKSFAGRILDQHFLDDLPAGVDPCGENGEFHTFCYQAPYFRKPIKIVPGDFTYREYTYENKAAAFWHCGLLPG